MESTKEDNENSAKKLVLFASQTKTTTFDI